VVNGRRESVGLTCDLEMDAYSPFREGINGNQELFRNRFSRSRNSLLKLAVRLLHHHGDAQQAVHNCRLSAARDVPEFKTEGAFRSWLFRILITEAVLLLNRRKANAAVADQDRDWSQFGGTTPDPDA
jgi:DNA-directed RNA polymerase specialized sigma24 family protein